MYIHSSISFSKFLMFCLLPFHFFCEPNSLNVARCTTHVRYKQIVLPTSLSLSFLELSAENNWTRHFASGRRWVITRGDVQSTCIAVSGRSAHFVATALCFLQGMLDFVWEVLSKATCRSKIQFAQFGSPGLSVCFVAVKIQRYPFPSNLWRRQQSTQVSVIKTQ